MIAAVIVAVELVAALTVAYEAVRHFNAMSKSTHHGIAAAWMVLGGSAVAMLTAPLTGDLPHDWRVALLMASVAALSVMDRRRTYLWNHSPRA